MQKRKLCSVLYGCTVYWSAGLTLTLPLQVRTGGQERHEATPAQSASNLSLDQISPVTVKQTRQRVPGKPQRVTQQLPAGKSPQTGGRGPGIDFLLI